MDVVSVMSHDPAQRPWQKQGKTDSVPQLKTYLTELTGILEKSSVQHDGLSN